MTLFLHRLLAAAALLPLPLSFLRLYFVFLHHLTATTAWGFRESPSAVDEVNDLENGLLFLQGQGLGDATAAKPVSLHLGEEPERIRGEPPHLKRRVESETTLGENLLHQHLPPACVRIACSTFP